MKFVGLDIAQVKLSELKSDNSRRLDWDQRISLKLATLNLWNYSSSTRLTCSIEIGSGYWRAQRKCVNIYNEAWNDPELWSQRTLGRRKTIPCVWDFESQNKASLT